MLSSLSYWLILLQTFLRTSCVFELILFASISILCSLSLFRKGNFWAEIRVPNSKSSRLFCHQDLWHLSTYASTFRDVSDCRTNFDRSLFIAVCGRLLPVPVYRRFALYWYNLCTCICFFAVAQQQINQTLRRSLTNLLNVVFMYFISDSNYSLFIQRTFVVLWWSAMWIATKQLDWPVCHNGLFITYRYPRIKDPQKVTR